MVIFCIWCMVQKAKASLSNPKCDLTLTSFLCLDLVAGTSLVPGTSKDALCPPVASAVSLAASPDIWKALPDFLNALVCCFFFGLSSPVACSSGKMKFFLQSIILQKISLLHRLLFTYLFTLCFHPHRQLLPVSLERKGVCWLWIFTLSIGAVLILMVR